MSTRTALLLSCFLFIFFKPLFAQNEILDAIDQAKGAVIQKDYQEASQQLTKALQLINDNLLIQLKAAFPNALKGWRADDCKGTISNISSLVSLNVKRSYFKKGGGSSVDIKMVTNSMKIANIKMLFSSPSMLNRAGENLKISYVANRRCIERYDPIDRYAELIFVPTSTLMVTIIGQDTKNLKTVIKYAEKINWNELEVKFP